MVLTGKTAAKVHELIRAQHGHLRDITETVKGFYRDRWGCWVTFDTASGQIWEESFPTEKEAQGWLRKGGILQ